MIKRELIRHSLIISEVWEIIYSNPKHIRGVRAYQDKRRLLLLRNRVRDKAMPLRRKDFLFLERMINKYS